MTNNVVLKISDLSKQYFLGKYDPYRKIRHTHWFQLIRSTKQKMLHQQTPPHSLGGTESIWALKNISFEVSQGETIGIIGRNGAGKSTLLKILAKITKPTSGYVDISGRLGALLEVGTGFHPELTGRENIYLNATILGMQKNDIKRRFDEIVDFAEIEQFIDTPVKHYSSGMYMRLAFSVAAYLEPEILIIDEVLAVGDAAFQQKSMGLMEGVAMQGRTVLFVSHNMAAVQKLCSRSILLSSGQLVADGKTSDIINKYIGIPEEQCSKVWDDLDLAPGDNDVKLFSVRVMNESQQTVNNTTTGEDFFIEMQYMVLKENTKMGTTIVITNQDGVCVLSSPSNHETNWYGKSRPKGKYKSVCKIPRYLLPEGQYSITCIIWKDYYSMVLKEDNILSLSILDSAEVRGDYLGYWSGVIRPYLNWETENLE